MKRHGFGGVGQSNFTVRMTAQESRVPSVLALILQRSLRVCAWLVKWAIVAPTNQKSESNQSNTGAQSPPSKDLYLAVKVQS